MNKKCFRLLRLPEMDNALPMSFSGFFFSATRFLEYLRNRSKIYFTEQQTANAIQLFVVIKGNFSGLFFF